MLSRTIAVCGLLFLAACAEEPDFPGAGITFKNDIQDASYNMIEVQGTSGSWVSARLRPSERLNIPGTAAMNFTFRRRYADHSKVYKVECPARTKRIRLKLIDVHLNRMAGGCVLRDFQKVD